MTLSTILPDQWEKLSKIEQELLFKLGIKPKETLIKQKKTPEGEQFILAVHITCGLCEKSYVQYWKMSPALKDNCSYHQGKLLKVSKTIIADKVEHYWQPTCLKCKRNLSSIDKEILIRKLIHYALYANIRQEGEKK